MTEVLSNKSEQFISNKQLVHRCRCDKDAFRARLFDIPVHYRREMNETREKIKEYKEELKLLSRKQQNVLEMLEYRWYNYPMQYEDEKERWDILFEIQAPPELAEENKLMLQDKLEEFAETENAIRDRIRGCHERINSWKTECHGNSRVVKSLVKDLQQMSSRKCRPQLDHMRETYTMADWEAVLEDIGEDFWKLYQSWR